MENVFPDWKTDFDRNLAEIRENIAAACARCGRAEDSVELLAATKTVEYERVRYAVERGVTLLGENRAQEMLEKYPALPLPDARMHMIGHVQRRKVKQLVGKADMIESVDSAALASDIARCSRELGICTDILLEVNLGGEESKSGFAPEAAADAALEAASLQGVRLRGLMAIPPVCERESDARAYFSALHKLFIDISGRNGDNSKIDVLSMGMSGDYVLAVEEGATLVRIGSLLFGRRPPR